MTIKQNTLSPKEVLQLLDSAAERLDQVREAFADVARVEVDFRHLEREASELLSRLQTRANGYRNAHP